jgi:hypothetical protein
MKALRITFYVTILVALTFSSCKKSIEDGKEPFNNIKFETLAWFQVVKANLSDTIQKLTNAKLETLDYAASKVINQAKGDAKFFFVKTIWKSSLLEEFLSFVKINNTYHTIGLVRVLKTDTENELRSVEEFVINRHIEKNARLSFYGLDNRHYISYEGIAKNGFKTVKVEDELRLGRNRLANSRTDGCIDWYIVTTYTYPDGTQYTTEEYYTTTCNGNNCEASNPYGGNLECINQSDGGGFSALENNDNVEGVESICDKSFKFKKHIEIDPTTTVGGWQVAGVRNIHMNIVNTTTGQLVPLQLPIIYFGLPVIRQNGDFYSTSTAAGIAADAVEYAERKVLEYYNATGGGAIDVVGMHLYYRNKINEFMQTKGGSASLMPGSNVTDVNVNDAVYSGIFGLNCL